MSLKNEFFPSLSRMSTLFYTKRSRVSRVRAITDTGDEKKGQVKFLQKAVRLLFLPMASNWTVGQWEKYPVQLDRAISTKFLTHRVSLQSSHANFPKKKFVLPKMAAILNFRIFAQKLQNTKMLISRKPCYIERFRRNF